MALFRVTLLLVVFLVQYVLFRRVWKWLRTARPTDQWIRSITLGLFLLFNGIFLVIVLLRPRMIELPWWFEVIGIYPFYIWYGATFFLGIVVLVSSLIKLPFKSLLWISTRFSRIRDRVTVVKQNPAFQEFDASRRIFLRRSMYTLTAVSFGGTAYGALVGRTHPELTTAEFTIASLPPALDGFTIALASDVHSSIFMTKREMDKYVSLLNGMNADLIVIPGDFVSSFTDEVYPFAEAFSALRAPYGVFGVMGNHDFYAGDPERVAREVNDCGVRMLRNDHVTISKGAAQFELLGVDDVGGPGQAKEKMRIARIGSNPDLPQILLCHRPYFLPQASEHKVDLMLSGHTHGGQIVLGSLGKMYLTPAAMASPYIWGTYRHNATAMYVSRGIGTVGLPIRINCPPELTRIVLRSGRLDKPAARP
jgi:predicted MPP superfamily phosphohydrolase